MNAILLAGGRSSRFGSNKALLRIGKKTLIEKIVEKLKKTFSNIIVVGSEETDYSFLKGVTIIQDFLPGMGPIGGLYTGLTYTKADYNFVMACDMPFLTERYFIFFRDITLNYQVIIPSFRGYIEPLAGVYSKECLPAIKIKLLEGDYKIKSFYSLVKVLVFDEKVIKKLGEPGKLFYNINRKDDLLRIL